MKVFLLHPDRDLDLTLDLERALPPHETELAQDLELDTLFTAMADGNAFLADVARRVVPAGLTDVDTIRYRQRTLTDCLDHEQVVRQIYDIAVDALQAPRKAPLGFFLRDSPEAILSRAAGIMNLLLDYLKQLRRLADEHAAQFRSDGFSRFFAMVADELDDQYLASIVDHLAELQLRRGVLMSAELGTGNKGVRYVLHLPPRLSWWDRLTGKEKPGFTFQLPERDESGARALSELRGQGVNLVANALAQSADHVQEFFRQLRGELAFYLGCLNLRRRLDEQDEPTCLPEPQALAGPVLEARGLYDPCLALTLGERTVGNDVDADGTTLVMITGANQGGKSTFLRAMGLAHLMMQSGMFVAAHAFRANVCRGVFTHFKREEDATMAHGKLDEELYRMSAIADEIVPGCLLLCNESFASTNEREGSEIARHIVRALTESGVKVAFVTHLYDLAHSMHEQHLDTALFLRAERRADGRRTYRLMEGEPLPTSYGEDSYRRVFITPSEVGLRTNHG